MSTPNHVSAQPSPQDLPPVGAKVWVPNSKRPFTCRARGKRYAVCTQPFNLRRTVLYFVLDKVDRWRAPEGLVFELGAETDEDCRGMLLRLEGGQTQLSRRRGVAWDVVRVEASTPTAKAS